MEEPQRKRARVSQSWLVDSLQGVLSGVVKEFPETQLPLHRLFKDHLGGAGQPGSAAVEAVLVGTAQVVVNYAAEQVNLLHVRRSGQNNNGTKTTGQSNPNEPRHMVRKTLALIVKHFLVVPVPTDQTRPPVLQAHCALLERVLRRCVDTDSLAKPADVATACAMGVPLDASLLVTEFLDTVLRSWLWPRLTVTRRARIALCLFSRVAMLASTDAKSLSRRDALLADARAECLASVAALLCRLCLRTPVALPTCGANTTTLPQTHNCQSATIDEPVSSAVVDKLLLMVRRRRSGGSMHGHNSTAGGLDHNTPGPIRPLYYLCLDSGLRWNERGTPLGAMELFTSAVLQQRGALHAVLTTMHHDLRPFFLSMAPATEVFNMRRAHRSRSLPPDQFSNHANFDTYIHLVRSSARDLQSVAPFGCVVARATYSRFSPVHATRGHSATSRAEASHGTTARHNDPGADSSGTPHNVAASVVVDALVARTLFVCFADLDAPCHLANATVTGAQPEGFHWEMTAGSWDQLLQLGDVLAHLLTTERVRFDAWLTRLAGKWTAVANELQGNACSGAGVQSSSSDTFGTCDCKPTCGQRRRPPTHRQVLKTQLDAHLRVIWLFTQCLGVDQLRNMLTLQVPAVDQRAGSQQQSTGKSSSQSSTMQPQSLALLMASFAESAHRLQVKLDATAGDDAEPDDGAVSYTDFRRLSNGMGNSLRSSGSRDPVSQPSPSPVNHERDDTGDPATLSSGHQHLSLSDSMASPTDSSVVLPTNSLATAAESAHPSPQYTELDLPPLPLPSTLRLNRRGSGGTQDHDSSSTTHVTIDSAAGAVHRADTAHGHRTSFDWRFICNMAPKCLASRLGYNSNHQSFQTLVDQHKTNPTGWLKLVLALEQLCRNTGPALAAIQRWWGQFLVGLGSGSSANQHVRDPTGDQSNKSQSKQQPKREDDRCTVFACVLSTGWSSVVSKALLFFFVNKQSSLSEPPTTECPVSLELVTGLSFRCRCQLIDLICESWFRPSNEAAPQMAGQTSATAAPAKGTVAPSGLIAASRGALDCFVELALVTPAKWPDVLSSLQLTPPLSAANVPDQWLNWLNHSLALIRLLVRRLSSWIFLTDESSRVLRILADVYQVIVPKNQAAHMSSNGRHAATEPRLCQALDVFENAVLHFCVPCAANQFNVARRTSNGSGLSRKILTMGWIGTRVALKSVHQIMLLSDENRWLESLEQNQDGIIQLQSTGQLISSVEQEEWMHGTLCQLTAAYDEDREQARRTRPLRSHVDAVADRYSWVHIVDATQLSGYYRDHEEPRCTFLPLLFLKFRQQIETDGLPPAVAQLLRVAFSRRELPLHVDHLVDFVLLESPALDHHSPDAPSAWATAASFLASLCQRGVENAAAAVPWKLVLVGIADRLISNISHTSSSFDVPDQDGSTVLSAVAAARLLRAVLRTTVFDAHLCSIVQMTTHPFSFVSADDSLEWWHHEGAGLCGSLWYVIRQALFAYRQHSRTRKLPVDDGPASANTGALLLELSSLVRDIVAPSVNNQLLARFTPSPVASVCRLLNSFYDSVWATCDETRKVSRLIASIIPAAAGVVDERGCVVESCGNLGGSFDWSIVDAELSRIADDLIGCVHHRNVDADQNHQGPTVAQWRAWNEFPQQTTAAVTRLAIWLMANAADQQTLLEVVIKRLTRSCTLYSSRAIASVSNVVGLLYSHLSLSFVHAMVGHVLDRLAMLQNHGSSSNSSVDGCTPALLDMLVARSSSVEPGHFSDSYLLLCLTHDVLYYGSLAVLRCFIRRFQRMQHCTVLPFLFFVRVLGPFLSRLVSTGNGSLSIDFALIVSTIFECLGPVCGPSEGHADANVLEAWNTVFNCLHHICELAGWSKTANRPPATVVSSWTSSVLKIKNGSLKAASQDWLSSIANK